MGNSNMTIFILIIIFASLIPAQQNRPVTTEKRVIQSIIDYLMEDTEKYSDEIKKLEAEAIEYASGFRKLGLQLMRKQTEPIEKAIKLAEEMGKQNCIEPDLLPDVILNNEFETVDDCDEVDDKLDTYLSEIEEVNGYIESLKESAEESIRECGSDYIQPKTHACLEEVAETYKYSMTETFEQNLEVLREEFNNLVDGQYSKLFVCLVEARSAVLKVSRLGAARIHACVFNQPPPIDILESPPIKFLRLPSPSPAYLHIVETLDELSL